MDRQIDELNERFDKIEEQRKQEILTLIEILSNVTFFGEMKRENCEFSKNGQCSYFSLRKREKNRLPLISECRVEGCNQSKQHYHLEVSNITCALCQNNHHSAISEIEKQELKMRQ